MDRTNKINVWFEYHIVTQSKVTHCYVAMG
jgi:hypothetical protein